jgi:hypothetical protein
MELRARRFDLVWSAVALCAIALAPVLSHHYSIFALVPPLMCFIVAALVVAWRFAQSRRHDAAVLSGAIALVGVLAGPVHSAGASVTTTVRFKLHRTDFDVIVLRETAHHANPGAPDLRYIVEAGPPTGRSGRQLVRLRP